ncbi:MAG: VCBS repeat-containing protein, partial [Desulfobulbaceae bacterium]|nr:VCBS repeat-containing protein [Candidatus Desulfatifera sulfidica]
MSLRVAVMLFSCLLLPAIASAGEPPAEQGSRVLFLPFETSAAGDYAYLADPVRNMLVARLAVGAGVEPVEGVETAGLLDGDGRVIPARLDALMDRYQADYLVAGRLDQSGERLTFQALVLALAAEENHQEFTAEAAGGAGVMTAIDQLAAEMSRRVFAPGRMVPLAEQSKTALTAPPVFQSPHPERAYKQGIYAVESALEGVEGLVPESLEVRRSGILPLTVQAMDVGDLDGDGLDEIVTASHGRILLYQERDGIFRQQHESPLPAGLRVHALTVADVDGDGRAEIYVSATDQEEAASLVLLWQEGNLHVRSSGLAWYLRPVAVPGEGLILLGQQTGMDSLLSPGVYRLSESKSALTGGPLLSLPAGVDLFDFIFADVTGDGAPETVAVDGNERILVYSPAGELLWAGGGDYSGSFRFLGLPAVAAQ